MFHVYWQETDKIEFTLSEEITRDEFRQIIHQIESLCAMYHQVNVLFDAANVTSYNFNIILREFDFYTKYQKNLRRVAVVSDENFNAFLLKMFNIFSDTEFKSFAGDEIEAARAWIFPSRLP